MSEPPPKIRPEAAAAAKWWAQWLVTPAVQDNGGRDPSNMVAMSMLQKIGDKERFTADDARRFESALAGLIETDMESRRNRVAQDGFSLSIYIDYWVGPTHILDQACKAANLKTPDGRFPIKTDMNIEPGWVTVRQSYGGKEEVIYSIAGRQRCLFVGGFRHSKTARFVADPPKPVSRLEWMTDQDEQQTLLHYDCHLFFNDEKQVPVYVLRGMDMEEAKRIFSETERSTAG